jgi:hypothetical protein
MLTGDHRQDVFARDRWKSSPFEQHADFFQLDLKVIEKKFGGEFYSRLAGAASLTISKSR